MSKAYDRISWLFLMKVMRKMDFTKVFIDIIWRLIANNWYPIIINRKSYGSFHSTGGIKQADPYCLHCSFSLMRYSPDLSMLFLKRRDINTMGCLNEVET